MDRIKLEQLLELFQPLDELSTTLESAITLSIVAAGSDDFSNHDEHLAQNYWNIVLNYLHKSQSNCNEILSKFQILKSQIAQMK